MDSTHFQTYGHQYRKAFNAHYQAQSFHPLMAFDGMTGDCLKVELRASNVYTLPNVVSFFPVLSRFEPPTTEVTSVLATLINCAKH